MLAKPKEEENITNGDSDILKYQENLLLLEEAKKAKETESLKRIVEPLSDVTEELTDAVKELTDAIKLAKQQIEEPQEGFYDKELNNNLTSSINRVAELLQNFKQVDLTPITLIAKEIKSQNSSLINLINTISKETNKEGYENLVREVLSMVAKSNDLIAKGLQQTDYSGQFKTINQTLERLVNRPIKFVSTIKREQFGNAYLMDEVTTTGVENKK